MLPVLLAWTVDDLPLIVYQASTIKWKYWAISTYL